MFVWIGIDVDDQVINIKEKVKEIESKVLFKNSNLTLPFHISLKMSFNVDENIFEDVINDVADTFNSINPFEIFIDKIEDNYTICWIKMKENKTLNQIHNTLNSFLKEKYEVPLHEYDMDYQFHITLFMDDNSSIVNKAFNLIKDEPLPNTLIAKTFLIGCSKSGELGSYKVIKQIKK